jgi:ArsR family transcriptional regulator, arsenate/arsenite/antimonite-responsive transcriptional repressor
MDKTLAVLQLAALAQMSRLDVFKSLVVAGADGLAAGTLAAQLLITPSALSFHTKELRHAGLIRSEARGRFVLFFAEFEAMRGLLAYLLENCCAGVSTQTLESVLQCAPTLPCCPAPPITSNFEPPSTVKVTRTRQQRTTTG